MVGTKCSEPSVRWSRRVSYVLVANSVLERVAARHNLHSLIQYDRQWKCGIENGGPAEPKTLCIATIPTVA
jgi:hypothetical protein